MSVEVRFLRAQVYQSINDAISNEVAANNSESSWLPSLVEQRNELYLRPDYIEPRLPYFRTMLLDGGAIAYPECQVPDWSWYSTAPLRHLVRAYRAIRREKRLFQSILNNLDHPWTEFHEDLIGNPYFTREFLIIGEPETEANIRNSFYYGLLSRFVPMSRIASILDVGGGFGALIGRIGLRHPEIKLLTVELPRGSVLSFYYLNEKLGAKLWLEGPIAFGQHRVNVLLPWVISELDASIDLAINTMSFQHMDARNLRYYFSNLRRLGVRYIFSINREMAMRPSEVPYLDTATYYGYQVDTRASLEPWSDEHFVHILKLV